jgi:hypothetical protein
VQPEATPIGTFSLAATSDVAIDSFPDGFSHHPVTVLQGSTGHIVLTRSASSYIAIHRAGKKLHPALLFVTFHSVATTSKYGARLTWAALSPAGKTLYTGHHGISVKPVSGQTSANAGANYGQLGDVEPDGALDLQLDFDAKSSSAAHTHQATFFGILNGRHGAVTKTLQVNPADGSLHKGAGTDLLRATVAGKHVELAAYQGSNAKRFYRRKVAGVGSAAVASAFGARVTGHRCSDVLLSAASRHKQVVAVLTARGTPLWSLRFDTNALAGGTLSHHKAPKHYCL